MNTKKFPNRALQKSPLEGGFRGAFMGLLLLLSLLSCRKNAEILKPEIEAIAAPDTTATIPTSEGGGALLGFYLLNEGNMGSNKSTLDYFDFATGKYHRNIYGDANPGVPKELGDVGNDLAIYGSKLYAVINCSNKVEVMDKRTARRLGQINIPNCRYIKFHGGYAYVTSYAGPVELNPYYEQTGYVAKIDTATFRVVAQCLVGFQPDDLEIVDFPLEVAEQRLQSGEVTEQSGCRAQSRYRSAGAKIYVANSGGYMAPNYESTVSVIDIQSFTEIKRIEVAINLHRLKADRHGNLWVSSRGDYYNTPSKLYWIDTKTDTYGGAIDIPVTGMTLDGDSLYFFSTEFNYYNYDWTINFGIVDVTTKQIVTRNFLAPSNSTNTSIPQLRSATTLLSDQGGGQISLSGGGGAEITMPYGIMVNPKNKDVYLTDAANMVFPGMLYCFDRHGNKKWTVRTGDLPAHFVMLQTP